MIKDTFALERGTLQYPYGLAMLRINKMVQSHIMDHSLKSAAFS